MNIPPEKKWATVHATKEFIAINTCSGYFRSAIDPEGEMYLLATDASEELLGRSIVDALVASRFLSLEEVSSFFDSSTKKKNYEDWVALLLDRYGYKSRTALFKNMKYCYVYKINGVIMIIPSSHDKLEEWGSKGIKSTDDEAVDENSSHFELGAALKRCLEKCK